jgi:hypothetical protein
MLINLKQICFDFKELRYFSFKEGKEYHTFGAFMYAWAWKKSASVRHGNYSKNFKWFCKLQCKNQISKPCLKKENRCMAVPSSWVFVLISWGTWIIKHVTFLCSSFIHTALINNVYNWWFLFILKATRTWPGISDPRIPSLCWERKSG